MQSLPKVVTEFMFRLTDFAERLRAGIRKPLMYSESGFQKLLRKATGGFQLAGHKHKNTFILISGLPKGFSHS
jgi:hypothetical protein